MIADRYRVERELGEGGFGSVYEATEQGGERRVAIKVLKPDDGRGYKPSTRARFEREARIVGQLQSSHTVTLLDFGESDGKLFMVFELVPGVDLSEIINRQGRLRPNDAAHVLRQLFDSLSEAHRAGILHRDLKPANIRVFERGDDPMFVKLLDFGLARPSDDGSPGVTKTGEIIGTPRYMSPEQLRAQPLTPASDVYGLGIVLLEMLVGSDALHGPRLPDQFERLMEGHFFSVPGHLGIEPKLVHLIERMTDLSVGTRLQTISAAARALDGGETPPRTPPEPVPRPRWPWVARALGAAVVLALVAALFNARGAPRPSVSHDAASDRLARLNRAAAEVKAAEPVDVDVDSGPAPKPPLPRGPLPANNPRPNAGCEVNTPPKDLRFLAATGSSDGPRPLLVVLPRDVSPVEYTLNVVGSNRVQRRDYRLASRTEYVRGAGLMDLAAELEIGLFIPGVGRGWQGELDTQVIRKEFRDLADNACIDLSRVYLLADYDGGEAGLPLSCEPWVSAFISHAHLT